MSFVTGMGMRNPRALARRIDEIMEQTNMREILALLELRLADSTLHRNQLSGGDEVHMVFQRNRVERHSDNLFLLRARYMITTDQVELPLNWQRALTLFAAAKDGKPVAYPADE